MKKHDKNCKTECPCTDCLDTDRYCQWVKSLGVIEAQRLQHEIEKNKRKFSKLQTKEVIIDE